MKTWMKILMWFGLGAGIGYFAGLQTGLRGADKAFEDGRQAEKEQQKRTSEAQDALKKYTDKFMHEYYGDMHGDISGISSQANPVGSITTAYNSDVNKDEDTFRKEEEEDPEMPSEEDLAIDPEIPQLHPQHLVPEIIGEEEFNLNIWHYDIENLLFYEMDEVLYNETTQSIIEDPDSVIGIGTLFEFGGDPNNPVYTIYVKNDTYGTLFRIESIDAAFCDAVDGTCGPDEDENEEDDGFWNDV